MGYDENMDIYRGLCSVAAAASMAIAPAHATLESYVTPGAQVQKAPQTAFDFNKSFEYFKSLIKQKVPFSSPKYHNEVLELIKEYPGISLSLDDMRNDKNFRVDYLTDEIVVTCRIIRPDGSISLDFRFFSNHALEFKSGPNGEFMRGNQYERAKGGGT